MKFLRRAFDLWWEAAPPTEEEEDWQRFKRRQRLRRVALVVVLLGALVLAVRPAARAVRGWQARRVVAEALAAIERRDWPAAAQSAHDAALLAPAEPLVSLANARLLSASPTPHPDAVRAWRRVRDAYPGDDAHRLALALALVRAGQAEEARREFLAAAPAVRASADGRMTEAALALAADDLAAAENGFRAVLALDPAHEAARLNLGVLLLRGGPARAAEGIALLEAVAAADSSQARPAALALYRHALAVGNASRALAAAERLAAPPDGTFEDRLRLVPLLGAPVDLARRERLLALLRREAAEEAPAAARLVAVLLGLGRGDEAAEWALTLPAERQRAPSLAPVLAELWDARADLPRLRDLVRSADWGDDIPGRHAFAARLAALDGLPAARAEAWGRAMKAAGTRPTALERLLALAERWQWPGERFAALRRLVEAAPGDARHARELWSLAAARRDTEGVWLATGRLLDGGDASAGARNDFAGAALLLGRDLARAHRLAWENFQAAPADPIVAATAATSLRLQGRAAEAREVIGRFAEPLPPALALERAACLAEVDAPEAARAAAARLPGEDWFPEEKRLVENLRREGKIFRAAH